MRGWHKRKKQCKNILEPEGNRYAVNHLCRLSSVAPLRMLEHRAGRTAACCGAVGRGGSGLGLHIVYNLVTRVLGGRIAVHSAPDAGTRFVLTLPRVAPAPEAHAPDTGLPGDAPFSFEDHGPII